MSEKNIFVYKLFCRQIFQIIVFLCKNCKPLKKETPSFPLFVGRGIPLKIEILWSPPPPPSFLKFDRRFNPLWRKLGGHTEYLNFAKFETLMTFYGALESDVTWKNCTQFFHSRNTWWKLETNCFIFFLSGVWKLLGVFRSVWSRKGILWHITPEVNYWTIRIRLEYVEIIECFVPNVFVFFYRKKCVIKINYRNYLVFSFKKFVLTETEHNMNCIANILPFGF